ncbi:tRNA (adenosine(37)-N6)-dimethylallyltransferase MiaA, partial [Campylobacter sp. TTU-622]
MFFEFALIGPTASGKTAIANALAYEFKAAILSLDSLCIYKQINIANAKSEDKILNELDYFGVNLLNVNEHFNVSLFMQEYEKAKKWAQDKQKILIITGGTSFYLKILMQGLSEKIEEKEITISNNEIYELLQKIDPTFKIEKNDTYRLKKWFNIYESTKEIPSVFLKKTQKKPLIEKMEIYNLSWDKEELRKNIQKRTKLMLDLGLVDEAKNLFEKYDANLKPLNSIGLKECKAYLNNQISY